MRRTPAPAPLLAVLLAVLAPAAAAPEDDGAGPPGVLERLQHLVHEEVGSLESARDLLLVRPERQEVEESASARLVPRLPPGCAMVELAALDAATARARLADLFRLYGFDVRPAYDLAAGGAAARLDGYDPEAKVGFRLVHGDLPPRATGDPAAGIPEAEPPAVALTPEEIRAFARHGHRILAVPIDRFVSTEHDVTGPLLTCLLDAAGWLNEVSDRPPLAVDALAPGAAREIRVPDLPPDALPVTQPLQQDDTAIFAVTAKRASFEIVLVPPTEAVPRRTPVLLVLPFDWLPPWRPEGYDRKSLVPHFELEQTGATPVRVTSSRAAFLLPPRFDATRPFRVRIDLPPGQMNLGRRAVLFVAPP